MTMYSDHVPPSQVMSVLQIAADDGTRYLQRSILGSSQCRPLLITGGKGSGKTSVARAIAAQIECDRHILSGEYPARHPGMSRMCVDNPEIIYEDAGRVSPEGRLPVVKETIQGWLDDARIRKPAVLVMDDLDTLLGPENEVSLT